MHFGFVLFRFHVTFKCSVEKFPAWFLAGVFLLQVLDSYCVIYNEWIFVWRNGLSKVSSFVLLHVDIHVTPDQSWGAPLQAVPSALLSQLTWQDTALMWPLLFS